MYNQGTDRLAPRRNFVLRAKAPGTNVDPLRLAFNRYRSLMNVGKPPGPRPALGVADVVSGLTGFQAQFASGHDLTFRYAKFQSRIIERMRRLGRTFLRRYLVRDLLNKHNIFCTLLQC